MSETLITIEDPPEEEEKLEGFKLEEFKKKLLQERQRQLWGQSQEGEGEPIIPEPLFEFDVLDLGDFYAKLKDYVFQTYGKIKHRIFLEKLGESFKNNRNIGNNYIKNRKLKTFIDWVLVDFGLGNREDVEISPDDNNVISQTYSKYMKYFIMQCIAVLVEVLDQTLDLAYFTSKFGEDVHNQLLKKYSKNIVQYVYGIYHIPVEDDGFSKRYYPFYDYDPIVSITNYPTQFFYETPPTGYVRRHRKNDMESFFTILTPSKVQVSKDVKKKLLNEGFFVWVPPKEVLEYSSEFETNFNKRFLNSKILEKQKQIKEAINHLQFFIRLIYNLYQNKKIDKTKIYPSFLEQTPIELDIDIPYMQLYEGFLITKIKEFDEASLKFNERFYINFEDRTPNFQKFWRELKKLDNFIIKFLTKEDLVTTSMTLGQPRGIQDGDGDTEMEDKPIENNPTEEEIVINDDEEYEEEDF